MVSNKKDIHRHVGVGLRFQQRGKDHVFKGKKKGTKMMRV